MMAWLPLSNADIASLGGEGVSSSSDANAAEIEKS
jgi:hypothetical protein